MPTSLPRGRRCPDTRLRRLASRAIGESVGEVARTTIHDLLAAARARLERLEPEAAAQAAADGDAILVDIRSELQRAQDGTIDIAVCYPRNVLEWRVDPASSRADPVLSRDLGARLVLVCHEGYQSSLAAATLQDLGFARATDLAGGFQAWRAAGLPVRR
jgi:rhodanese-related sulfurtransferase